MQHLGMRSNREARQDDEIVHVCRASATVPMRRGPLEAFVTRTGQELVQGRQRSLLLSDDLLAVHFLETEDIGFEAL